jgi:hypothetical protein
MRGAFVDTMARFFREEKGRKRNPSAQSLVPCKGSSSDFIKRDLARGRGLGWMWLLPLFRIHG